MEARVAVRMHLRWLSGITISAYAADYGYVEKFVDYMVELGIQSGGAGCR